MICFDLVNKLFIAEMFLAKKTLLFVKECANKFMFKHICCDLKII